MTRVAFVKFRQGGVRKSWKEPGDFDFLFFFRPG